VKWDVILFTALHWVGPTYLDKVCVVFEWEFKKYIKKFYPTQKRRLDEMTQISSNLTNILCLNPAIKLIFIIACRGYLIYAKEKSIIYLAKVISDRSHF